MDDPPKKFSLMALDFFFRNVLVITSFFNCLLPLNTPKGIKIQKYLKVALRYQGLM